MPWTYVNSDLNGEEIVGTFYEKELQKNKSKRVKSLKSNIMKYMLNGKATIILLTVGLIKKT